MASAAPTSSSQSASTPGSSSRNSPFSPTEVPTVAHPNSGNGSNSPPRRWSDLQIASEELASLAAEFRRSGSVKLGKFSNPTIRDVCRLGFTGETYYDYDKNLDTSHPITIIHFNDVYNIEPDSEGSGGISRFVSALRQFSDTNPLILFSGDAFNPSFISTVTKGRHMVPFLNMTKIHTACVGNHDLDFGIDHLEYLAGSTRFPWLLSNVFDAYSRDRPLAGAGLYRLFEWQGHRVGIIGLVEQEWISTLAQVNEEDVVYQDYVEAADKLSGLLRAKECELIIALTHMRAPNDERLAKESKDLDLILGGHDHEYYGTMRICNSIVCKSGSDFREFTVMTIHPGRKDHPRLPKEKIDYYNLPAGIVVPGNRNGGAMIMPRFCGASVIEWDAINVTAENFAPNRHVDRLVAKYLQELTFQFQRPLGEIRVPLETRFGIIRTQEANTGNWLADLMRVNMKSDVAFINAGTLRSDCVLPAGTLTVQDLMNMLPMPDDLICLLINGAQLREVLENSVSQYPKTEGRFLQISGFKFTYDSRRNPGSRVIDIKIQYEDPATHTVAFRCIREDEALKTCTKLYLAQGKDGFDVLKNLPVLNRPEDCTNLQTMVRNSFSLAAMACGLRKARNPSTLRRLDTFKAMNEDQQKRLCGMTTMEGDCKLTCRVEGRIINLASVAEGSVIPGDDCGGPTQASLESTPNCKEQ